MTVLPDFSDVRVLCVGDVMLDRFVEGDVQRISPESPVPIILLSHSRSVPGGAANVGRNVSALGGLCTLIGCVGADRAGDELNALLNADPRISAFLVTDPARRTIEKTRYVAQGQHLLRADREDKNSVCQNTERAIVGRVADEISRHHVLVLSDYAKGVLTDGLIAELVALARRANVPIIVDPKSPRFERYAGATIVTPNAGEARAATGIDPLDDHAAERAGLAALELAKIDAVLLTRAERGLSLVQRNHDVVHIPASAREVFDVVGAGDTVIAALALCMGAGESMVDAARIANAAGGVVVGKHGTATLDRFELLQELGRLNGAGLATTGIKTVDDKTALSIRQTWGEAGLTVGFTNGCFDILHIGHVQMLRFARSQCDRLIVALNTDASVRRLKGPSRPINEEQDRAEIIGALGFVDLVVMFDEATPGTLIDELLPDILIKGSDYTVENIVGADRVIARGGKVLIFDLVPGRSTSTTINNASKAVEKSRAQR